MAQYAFDRAISVAGTYVGTNTAKGTTAGQLAFWAEQITEPSLSFTSETEDIVDARNNVVMVLQNGRGATFSANNAFFNTSILAAQTGSVVADSEDEIVVKYEMVNLDENGAGKLTYTPVAGVNEDAADPDVYELSSDGSFKTAIEATGITVAGKDITGGVKNGKVLVVYNIKAPKGEKIAVLADAENELLDVTAEVLLRDLCSQEVFYAFLFMRGKLSGEAEWSMARDGNHAFEITAMPAYCDAERKLVDIVIVRDNDMRDPAATTVTVDFAGATIARKSANDKVEIDFATLTAPAVEGKTAHFYSDAEYTKELTGTVTFYKDAVVYVNYV